MRRFEECQKRLSSVMGRKTAGRRSIQSVLSFLYVHLNSLKFEDVLVIRFSPSSPVVQSWRETFAALSLRHFSTEGAELFNSV